MKKIARILKKYFIVQYIFNYVYALSCLCNTLMLGDPRETVCSRSGKAIRLYRRTKKFTLFLIVAYPVHYASNILQRNHVFLYNDCKVGSLRVGRNRRK